MKKIEIREIEMPELTGSPKQIKWATDIRAQHVQWARELVCLPITMRAKARDLGGVELTPMNASDIATAIITELVSETSAAAWIDRRHDDLTPLKLATITACKKFKGVQ